MGKVMYRNNSFENTFSESSCACETIVAALLARGKSNFTGVHKTRRRGWARLSIKTMGFENPVSESSFAFEIVVDVIGVAGLAGERPANSIFALSLLALESEQD